MRSGRTANSAMRSADVADLALRARAREGLRGRARREGPRARAGRLAPAGPASPRWPALARAHPRSDGTRLSALARPALCRAGPARPRWPGSPRSPRGPAGPGSPAGRGLTALARRTRLTRSPAGPREPRGPRSTDGDAGVGSAAAARARVVPVRRARPAERDDGRLHRCRSTTPREPRCPGRARSWRSSIVRSGSTCTAPVSPVRSAEPTPAAIRGSRGGWRTVRSRVPRYPHPPGRCLEVGVSQGHPDGYCPTCRYSGCTAPTNRSIPARSSPPCRQAEAAGLRRRDVVGPLLALERPAGPLGVRVVVARRRAAGDVAAVRRRQRARPALPPGDHRPGDRHPRRDVPRPLLGGAGHGRGQQRAHHRRAAGPARTCATPGCASASTSSAPCSAARR